MSTEETRFTEAFNAVLERNPDKAPGPTPINLYLRKPPPHNILNGRMSLLRRRLLEEAGFTQTHHGGRWTK